MEAPGNGRATNKAYTMKAFRWKSENKAPDKTAGAERVLAPWPPLQGVLALRLLRSKSHRHWHQVCGAHWARRRTRGGSGRSRNGN